MLPYDIKFTMPNFLRIFIYTSIFMTPFLYFFKKTKKISSPFPSIDYILVKKQERVLEVYHQGKCLKSYTIHLGFCPTGAKEYEGDGKTPEGMYTICYKNIKSQYHLSLKIDYPHDHHIALAKKRGLSAGSDIMIHGQPNRAWGVSHPKTIPYDWTHGCMAVTNAEIEEIYGATSVGTPIEIRP